MRGSPPKGRPSNMAVSVSERQNNKPESPDASAHSHRGPFDVHTAQPIPRSYVRSPTIHRNYANASHGRDRSAQKDDFKPLPEVDAAVTVLRERRTDGQVAHLVGLELKVHDERQHHRLACRKRTKAIGSVAIGLAIFIRGGIM